MYCFVHQHSQAIEERPDDLRQAHRHGKSSKHILFTEKVE